MKGLGIAVSAVVSCFFLVSNAPATGARTRSIEIPFSLSEGLIVVQANINGKQVSLLFDSGAMRTFVNPSILADRKTSSVNAISITDGKVLDVRVVRTAVSLGDASFQVPVCSYDMSTFAGSVGLHIDGVIGQDVIGQFRAVLIDYARHRITLIVAVHKADE